MSNLQRIENLEQIVNKCETDFNALAAVHGAVNFKREASFAMQIMKDNPYVMSVAFENQDSLKMAVINVASIGLTLNPLKALAYLVPRKKKICLDISYRGMIHLAAEVGAIMWAKAETVYTKDTYIYLGMGERPVHKFEPFADRGKMLGVYCVAKTYADEFIVDHMSIDEVYKIRNRSESYKAYKRDSSKLTPWVTDETEMIKKTIIRRAWKMWPQVDTKKERFEKALEIQAEAEPIQLSGSLEPDEKKQILNMEKMRGLLETLGRTEEKFIEHLIRAFRRNIIALENLTEIETNQALTMLEQLVEQKRKKENR